MLLRDFVPRCALNFPNETAYIHGETRRTWREVHARTDALAGALQALGLRAGDAVGILSRHRIEVAEHYLACLKAGMPRTGLNWRYSEREVAYVTRDADCRALLVEAGLVEPMHRVLAALQEEGRLLIGIGDGHGLPHDYEALIGAANRFALPALQPEDVGLIGYTSGSTGQPKGVLLTQRNLMASTTWQVMAPGFTRDDVRLYVMNTSGVNIYTACSNILNGMCVILDEFQVDHVVDLIRRHGVTRTTLVPTMLRRLIDKVRADGAEMKSLKQVLYGSMPATPALIREAREVLGCELAQLYGASEACGPFTLLTGGDHEKAVGDATHLLTSVGRVSPHVRVSIRDEDGRELPRGSSGIVWVGGDVVMAGYRNRPEETREALPQPGWLRTGDVGFLDEEGYLYLNDRKKNLIISGGMNIHPQSVENALAEHPAVREAVVVGLPHPEWGEAVAAMVQLKAGAQAAPRDLADHCRARVAAWEVPKHIELVPQLPLGFTDKVDKAAVRSLLLDSPSLPWQVDLPPG